MYCENSESDTLVISMKEKKTGKKVVKGESSKSKATKNIEKKDIKRKRKGADKVESSKRRKKEKHSSSDEEVVKKKAKISKQNEWFGIRTRSSPLQLFKCISILKENQREAVRKMGFGKLLSFKVDGIPAKLGHYVVDNFNVDKMEIKVPCGKIKVDSKAIHQLLGLPCGGIQLDSITRLDPLDDTVRKWRKRYPGRFVAPTQLENKIESSEDEDNFNFRLDFLMLFLAIMVECHKQGSCREHVLEYIRGDTKFYEIDWCSYIVKSMKTCKEGWKRCDHSSPFAGPLTILTLLYVDSIECKGMNVNGNINAIAFWNMERLKIRQGLEIQGGGFGKGKFKGLTFFTNNPSEEDVQHIGENDFLDEMSKVKKRFDVMVKYKKKVEETLGQFYQKYPEKEEVLTLIAKYESLLEDKPTWPPKPTKKSMKTNTKIKEALAELGEPMNDDEERIDGERMDEEHDAGERVTNEDPILVAKFIIDFMQSEKSSAGGNETGSDGGEKLVGVGAEKVVDGDKQADSTRGNEAGFDGAKKLGAETEKVVDEYKQAEST